MTRIRRTAAETRNLIFEAASQILVDEGLSQLTLATVAQKAGLSKGGLLYHFPNKVSLIEGLFNHHNGRFEQRLEEYFRAEEDTPGAWLRAYARASLEEISDPDTAALYASLFAAEEKYPTAHQLMRKKYDKWQDRIAASRIDPDIALLIRLAVDGFWFAEMHEYAPPSTAPRERFLQLLLNLSRPSPGRS